MKKKLYITIITLITATISVSCSDIANIDPQPEALIPEEVKYELHLSGYAPRYNPETKSFRRFRLAHLYKNNREIEEQGYWEYYELQYAHSKEISKELAQQYNGKTIDNGNNGYLFNYAYYNLSKDFTLNVKIKLTGCGHVTFEETGETYHNKLFPVEGGIDGLDYWNIFLSCIKTKIEENIFKIELFFYDCQKTETIEIPIV